jgi:hypothetical protein
MKQNKTPTVIEASKKEVMHNKRKLSLIYIDVTDLLERDKEDEECRALAKMKDEATTPHGPRWIL